MALIARARKKRKPVAEMNVVPYIDVMLVLLVIFMVTSSVIVNANGGAAKAGLKVNLPKGGAADAQAKASDISVAILSDGRIVLSGDVVSADELKKALDIAKEKNPEKYAEMEVRALTGVGAEKATAH